MAIQTGIRELAQKLRVLVQTVPRSRNRHRELTTTFYGLATEMTSVAEKIEALQDACDTNMTLFESLLDLYERNHILIDPNCPKEIADFAKDLFRSMRHLIESYEEVKGEISGDSEASVAT